MKGKAGTETEVLMEESGAVAEAGAETVRRRGGGTGAETVATREAGSAAPSVNVIATDDMSGVFSCLLAAFRFSESFVMLLETCGVSHCH